MRRQLVKLLPMLAMAGVALLCNLPMLFQPPYNVGLVGPLPFFPDESAYMSLAHLMADGGPLAYLANPRSLETVLLWPSLLAAMLHLPHPFLWMRLFSELCLAAGIGGLYSIGTRLGGPRVGAAAGLLAIAFRPLDDFAPTILTEPLFFALCVASVAFFVRGIQDRRQGSLWVASGFLVLGTMVRPVLQLFPLFLLGYFAWLGYRERAFRFWAKAALPIVLVFVLLVGYGLRNAVTFHKAGLCNGSGAALWLGSRPDTEGDEPPYRGQSYAIETVTHGLSHVSIEGDRLLTQAAKANIKAHLADYCWWGVKKVGRLLVGNRMFWSSPATDPVAFATIAPPGLLGQTLGMLMLKSLLVVSACWLLLSRMGQPELGFLGIFSGYYVLMHTPVLVNPRYGIPLLGIWCVPAVLAGRQFFQRSARVRRRVWAPLLIVVLGILAYEIDAGTWGQRIAGFLAPTRVVMVNLSAARPVNVRVLLHTPTLVRASALNDDPQLLVSLPDAIAVKRLSFDAAVKAPTTFQVFYAASGKGFDEGHSLRMDLRPGQTHYDLQLDPRNFIPRVTSLRIDPVADRSEFSLSDVHLND